MMASKFSAGSDRVHAEFVRVGRQGCAADARSGNREISKILSANRVRLLIGSGTFGVACGVRVVAATAPAEHDQEDDY